MAANSPNEPVLHYWWRATVGAADHFVLSM